MKILAMSTLSVIVYAQKYINLIVGKSILQKN